MRCISPYFTSVVLVVGAAASRFHRVWSNETAAAIDCSGKLAACEAWRYWTLVQLWRCRQSTEYPIRETGWEPSSARHRIAQASRHCPPLVSTGCFKSANKRSLYRNAIFWFDPDQIHTCDLQAHCRTAIAFNAIDRRPATATGLEWEGSAGRTRSQASLFTSQAAGSRVPGAPVFAWCFACRTRGTLHKEWGLTAGARRIPERLRISWRHYQPGSPKS
jgi:hypothetical protein